MLLNGPNRNDGALRLNSRAKVTRVERNLFTKAPFLAALQTTGVCFTCPYIEVHDIDQIVNVSVTRKRYYVNGYVKNRNNRC
jgi:hypothetical protein